MHFLCWSPFLRVAEFYSQHYSYNSMLLLGWKDHTLNYLKSQRKSACFNKCYNPSRKTLHSPSNHCEKQSPDIGCHPMFWTSEDARGNRLKLQKEKLNYTYNCKSGTIFGKKKKTSILNSICQFSNPIPLKREAR